MKTKDIKRKGKRSISIFTVFLWLVLIITMVTIVVNSQISKNALETDEKVQTLKISVSGINVTDEIDEKFKNLKIKDSDNGTLYQYLGIDEEGKYVYEMVLEEHGENVKIYIPDIYGYNASLREPNGKFYNDDEYLKGTYLSKDYDENSEKYFYSPKTERLFTQIGGYVTGFKNEIEIEVLYKEANTSLQIKTTFENLPDGEIIPELYENLQFIVKAGDDDLLFEFDRIENGKYIYSSNNKIAYEHFSYCNIYINNNKYGDYKFDTTYTMGEYTVTRSYNDSKVGIPKSFFIIDGENELDVNINFRNERYGAFESVKWIDKENEIANVSIEYIHDKTTGTDEDDKYFVEKKLSSNFELSDEYENDADWKILGSVSDEIFFPDVHGDMEEKSSIPKDVAEQLFDVTSRYYEGDIYVKKVTHVYVKSTNIVYSYYSGTELLDNGFKEDFNIKLKESPITDVNLVSGNTSVKFITDYYYEPGDCGSGLRDYSGIYTLKPTYLKYDLNNKFYIKVNYLGKNDNVYVGLFTDETTESTSNVQKIDNDIAIFTLENININDNYYIYVVDENGNKINDSSIVYDRNKVEAKYVDNSNRRELLSLLDVVSSVGCNKSGTFYINEINFVDNCINDLTEYEDVINISVEEKELRDINIEKVWMDYDNKYNARPSSVQVEVYANNEKVNLFIIENKDWKYTLEGLDKYDEEGKEIVYTIKEVVIDRYESTIEGDMNNGFKVINKLITAEKPVDTSDINVWMYVVVAIASIVVIAIVCVVIVKSKNNRK